MTLAQEQSFFTMESKKKAGENIYPFYDAHEKTMEMVVFFNQKMTSSDFFLEWFVQKNGSKINEPYLYKGKLDSIPYPAGEFMIPINDTLVKSGNYQVLAKLWRRDIMKTVQTQVMTIQLFREKNNYFREVAKTEKNTLINQNLIDLSETFVDKYDYQTIQNYILTLEPIAEGVNYRILNDLIRTEGEENLKRFFYNFWAEKNEENPETAWKEYAEKLNYAAKKFGTGSMKGYQSDRGKFYLRYGEPNQIIHAPSERGCRPYEVWFYTEMETYTNIALVFVQNGNMQNNMVLAHSNSQSYFYNPGWEQMIFTDPGEVNNKIGHKIYEYIR